MSVNPPTTLSSRLIGLAQRLGLAKQPTRQILEQASQVRLPFPVLSGVPESIWWDNGPLLHRLIDLPRGALSGPVQEDKAEAHAYLSALVRKDVQHFDALDLRSIDGLQGNPTELGDFNSFEQYAATEACRSIRIISYKDFLKVLQRPLPQFLNDHPVIINEAAWRGTRRFWAGEQQGDALACALAYARLRQLSISLPAEVHRYSLNNSALNALAEHFHMLAMPHQAWSDSNFMALLLNSRLPYSRLVLMRSSSANECLLLPKRNSDAHALGEGLRIAGAADFVPYLQSLPS